MKRIFLSYNYVRDVFLVGRLKSRLRDDPNVQILDPLETMHHGDSLVPQVSSQIQRASIVVSFLGSNNPNVWYETGLAIGAGKSTLVVGSEPEALPMDLKLLPFVVLSGDTEADVSLIVERLSKLQVREEPAAHNYSSVQEKLETYWSDRSYFDSVSPLEFEEILFEWLQIHGFEPQASRGSESFGVDIMARSPASGQLIAIEAKKFSRQSRVSVKEVMSLLGAATLMRADKAALITSSGFTAAALEMAKRSRDVKLYLLTVEDLLQSPRPNLLFQ